MGLGELSILSSDTDVSDELQPGTELFHGQYTITAAIGSGGFGITYLAKDSLHRDVVIKECFAASYCRRTRSRVRPRSQGSKPELDRIIRHFLNEARRLASLTHPNIVGVHQVFEANDTAYMALDYIQGKDLLQMVEGRDPGLAPDKVRLLTRKLVAALAYVHDHQLLHCDISPDNIFLSQTDEPILIDFGAARILSARPEQKDSGLIVVKDGYSPHELYFAGGNIGPWTDLYAMAASVYHMVSGEVPVASQSRLAAIVERRPDPLKPLAGRFRHYPNGFLESVDKALGVMPANRFQSAAEWLEVLDQSEAVEGAKVRLFRKPPAPPTSLPSGPKSGGAAPVDATRAQKPPVSKGTTLAIDLSGLSEIAGFMGGCLVDSETGLMMVCERVGDFDLEAASAANTAVVKAKLRAIQRLGLDDSIEDILITLGKQFHLIRPLAKTPTIFIYVALDKKAANLGMARVQVKNVEQLAAT